MEVKDNLSSRVFVRVCVYIYYDKKSREKLEKKSFIFVTYLTLEDSMNLRFLIKNRNSLKSKA